MFHTPAHKQLDPSKFPAQRVNPVASNVPAERFDVVSQIMANEAGELDEEQTVELFQHLIDTGIVWSLQGSYGRAATQLIQMGVCTRAA